MLASFFGRSSDAAARKAPISRSDFALGAARLTRLAVDGLPGTLHPVRTLRNTVLQRIESQDEAVRQVAAGSAQLPNDPEALEPCLEGTGLPLALARALWEAVRPIALLVEVLGHDASASKGRLLCVVGGIECGAEPIISAGAHVLWHALCRSEERDSSEVGVLCDALAARKADAPADALRVFAADKREIAPSEHAAPIDELSLRQAKVIARALLEDEERLARAQASLEG